MGDLEQLRPAATDAALGGARLRRPAPLLDTVRVLSATGGRSPGSLAEAQAAAVVNGRLRQAGMQVAVDPFQAASVEDRLAAVLAVSAVAAMVPYGLVPLPATLALLLLLLAEVARCQGWLGRRRVVSQSVVATRAANEALRWRLVLVAPLDSPPLLTPLVQALAGTGWASRLRHLLAFVALATLAMLGLAYSMAYWWVLLLLPACYLFAVGLAMLVRTRAAPSPGAVSYSGSLAVLLAAAEQLKGLRHVELWIVALGATTAANTGMHDLLTRYPFEADRTLFIALDGVGQGRLTSITREGPWSHAADAMLLRLVAAADASDPLIDVEPRPYRATPTVLTPLLQRWRGLTLATLDLTGRVPLQGTTADTADQLDEQILDRTLRLVVAVARGIDETTAYG